MLCFFDAADLNARLFLMSGVIKMTDRERRTRLKNDINRVDVLSHNELFAVLKRHNFSNYTQNAFGVFFDLNEVGDEVLQDLEQAVEYYKSSLPEARPGMRTQYNSHAKCNVDGQ